MDEFDLKISWGTFSYVFIICLAAINCISIILALNNLQALVLILPVIVLDVMTYPLIRGIINELIRRTPDLSISQYGINIKGKSLPWHSVKSISLQTGRIMQDRNYFSGCKLPAYQKIFVLDKDGKEYECIIDVDYCLKKQREKNNYLKIISYLTKEKKIHLMADWAEKR